ncbi:ATP-NAD kinase family protein [Synergistaceae bacterium OttesenSCG-928-D05]|nr:ATP-NAD kinase family protein [Synergistaceae bacterium OttesenSCG-928-D05]
MRLPGAYTPKNIKVTSNPDKRRIGFLVNPVAGMGGKVALKGTDGEDTLRRALELGAEPQAEARAERALDEFRDEAKDAVFLTAGGQMGADLLEKNGLTYEVVLEVGKKTTFADTQEAVKRMLDAGAQSIVFAGGDGTARNVCEVAGDKIPVVGIPAGVKIHSGVYANRPAEAGMLVKEMLQGKVRRYREAEVMDIDEEAFRGGIVSAKLYGYMRVPDNRRFMQDRKSGSSRKDAYETDAIAAWVTENMQAGALYLIGSGSTTKAVMDRMELRSTLLGVDAVSDKKLLARDMNEQEILALMEKYPQSKRNLIITVIGGQGHIFGRGNQQLSPKVLMLIPKENITIIAAPSKMTELFGKSLISDTGDSALDKKFIGYMPVVTGFGRKIMARVA